MVGVWPGSIPAKDTWNKIVNKKNIELKKKPIELRKKYRIKEENIEETKKI